MLESKNVGAVVVSAYGETVQGIISERIGYSKSLDQFRRRLVEEALRECNGNRSQTARLLKMNRSNLVNMIKRLGIDL